MIGFAGSTHCLGMCGGIAGSLGTGMAADRTGRRWLTTIAYNLGRVGSYTLLGALAGLLVAVIGLGLPGTGWSAALRIATGAVLIAVAAYLLFDWSGLRRIEALGGRVWRHLAPLARRLLPVRSPLHALALGALWGWLPCGLVYTALLAAAASGDPARGAGIMLAFGLGTLPAMTGVVILGQRLVQWRGGLGTRRLGGALLLAFGVWTMASPLMHLLQHPSGDGHHGHHHAAAAHEPSAPPR
nr:sulfite exporter TauE/SafE family protein [Methylonatrum kenyense]